MACSRHLGWPEETGHRVPSRAPAPVPEARQHLRPDAIAGASGMTIPPGRAGRQLSCCFWRPVSLGSLFTHRSPSMTPKPILVPARLRHPPATGWSWVDRRFVREHMAYLSREAVLLYFFLSAVADKHGLSFYGDGTLAALLRMTLPALIEARDELLARDLIAHETRWTQVLSVPPCGERRRCEPGGGLMQLGEILRQAAALPHSNEERSLP